MRFLIEVEVERQEGKFAGRDEISEALCDAVREADLSGLGADGESEYLVEEAQEFGDPVQIDRALKAYIKVKAARRKKKEAKRRPEHELVGELDAPPLEPDLLCSAHDKAFRSDSYADGYPVAATTEDCLTGDIVEWERQEWRVLSFDHRGGMSLRSTDADKLEATLDKGTEVRVLGVTAELVRGRRDVEENKRRRAAQKEAQK